jgi:hypothetical protein
MITMNWPDGAADAGIDQRGEQIGAAAVDLLAGMFTRGERGAPAVSSTTMVEGLWMAGNFAARPTPPAATRA